MCYEHNMKAGECPICDAKEDEDPLELLDDFLDILGKITRRWRRHQGGAGAASCSADDARQIRDAARLPLIKELEAFVKENSKRVPKQDK